jgi:4-oxalocrotonate tautomerase
MPVINVQMLSGRTPEQKSALVSALAEVTQQLLGVPEDAVRVILTETPPENWGVGGRTMAEIRRLASPGAPSDKQR